MPVARPIFSEVQSPLEVSVETQFKASLARAANRSSDYISLDIIQEGNEPGTTMVTSRIAALDAQAAAVIYQNLDTAQLKLSFAAAGLVPTLMSVQVTSCVAGYELSSSQICKLCPSNYFCPGGSSGRQACSAGSFSLPGANSSSDCVPVVFVLVSVVLPTIPSNFTADVQTKFRAALALTALVPVERVVVTSESRRISEALIVNAEIAGNDAASAEAIRWRVDIESVNANLLLQGLPKSTSVVAAVANTGTQSIGSSAFSLPAVLAGSIGGFFSILVSCVAAYLLFKTLRRRQARAAFVRAVRYAQAGESASEKYFPPEYDKATTKGQASLSLQMQYDALLVLAKGSRGCVIKATKRSAQAAPVVIKIIVPKSGEFDQRERRQLQRESALLKLVTTRGCKSAVHTADEADLPQRNDASWFITVADLLNPRGALAESAFGIRESIQVARDVLAALKVLHSEGFVHCDVSPANILHLTSWQGSSYEYKLIDFGKVCILDEIFDSDADLDTGGTLAYRAPEMFSRCRVAFEADIWSLGATMFELVVGSLPFALEGRAAVIKAGKEVRALEVVGCLAELQRQSFDTCLDKVIAKALDREPLNR